MTKSSLQQMSESLIKKACVLSLCGWCEPENTESRSISCHICNRHVNKVDKPFNPLTEHRFYCPWAQVESPQQTASSSSSPTPGRSLRDGIPGWKLTLNSLVSLSTVPRPINIHSFENDNSMETGVSKLTCNITFLKTMLLKIILFSS